jgi:hypothetical protein
LPENWSGYGDDGLRQSLERLRLIADWKPTEPDETKVCKVKENGAEEKD